MISLTIVIQAAVAAVPSWSPALKAYSDCFERNTVQFERVHESVESTVKGVFAACRGECAVLVLGLADAKTNANKGSMSFDEAEAFVAGVIDKKMRDQATARLFALRSKGK